MLRTSRRIQVPVVEGENCVKADELKLQEQDLLKDLANAEGAATPPTPPTGQGTLNGNRIAPDGETRILVPVSPPTAPPSGGSRPRGRVAADP